MNNVKKNIIKGILLFLKVALLLITLGIIVFLLLQAFEVIHSWSYFFGYFQVHFNWNIWLIKIISLVTVFIFAFYILPSIYKLFNPLKPLSKKRIPAFIIVCFFCFLWFITYLSVKDQYFDREGKGLVKKAWAIDHYENVPLKSTVHPIYGTPAILVTPENISIFSMKKINVDENTVFFSPVDGTPFVYYYTTGSKVDFFNSKGRHPQYGEELLPVTPDIIKSYFQQVEADKKQAEAEETELMRQQEIERIQQEEESRQLKLQNEKISSLLLKIQEMEKQKESNPAPSSTQRKTNNTQPSKSSASRWIGNVEYYPEVLGGTGGVRFVNHNDYPVRILWNLPNGYEEDLRYLGGNQDFWTNYHISIISNVRVSQTW